MTIAEKLLAISGIKSSIASAIEDAGVAVGEIPFDEYPAKIALIGGGSIQSPWVRPSDWPALPTVTESDQKFVGLHAVWDDESNFCALSAEGAFTVDWGDGVVEDFSSGANAQHVYTYSDPELSAVTGRGFKCAIVTVTPQAGNNLTKLNLHVKHGTSGLQAYSSGFVDIALAGQYLTDLRIGAKTPGSTTQDIIFGGLEQVNIVRSDIRQANNLLYNCYSLSSVVDIATSPSAPVSVPVTFSDAGDTVNAVSHPFRNGDSVIFTEINTTTGITTYTNLFVVSSTEDSFKVSNTFGGSAIALTSDGSGTALRGTDFGGLFTGCYRLTSIPLLDTSAGTSFMGTFNGCTALASIPTLDTSAGRIFNSMFSTCSRLASVPLLDTSAGRYFNSMFASCQSLTSVPMLNTAHGVSFSAMFNGCRNLTAIPHLDTSKGTDLSSMFSSCSGLTSIPAIDTSSATNVNGMFNACTKLAAVPLLDTSSSTSFASMFAFCYSLSGIPALDTSSGTNFSGMFNFCHTLASVPALNTSAGTNFNSMFANCRSLSNIDATGFKESFSVASCKLGPAALNEIYTSLPTVTGKTITVTGNWGVASDDPTIATAKGWTVTG